MRIESYNVRMDSVGTRSSSSTRKLQISLQEQKNEEIAPQNNFADTYSSISAAKLNNTDQSPTAARDLQSVKQQFVLYLWRIFFGDDSAKTLSEKMGIEDLSSDHQSSGSGFHTIQLMGVEEIYEQESQSVSFSSQGHISTADGRSIDFNLDISMTSSFERYYRSEGVAISNLCDPLVLNFSGSVADLSDQKFTFDLDCDGEAEEISKLSAGNGFLALDKNGDGTINDGSELFGTKSGDGFSDLAEYDLDGNGWIDENDDIFNKLRVWYKDDDGNDKLLDLKESGVGAIYLGNTITDFNLRSSDDYNINGAIRKMGIFLYENATVGNIVHLDIAN